MTFSYFLLVHKAFGRTGCKTEIHLTFEVSKGNFTCLFILCNESLHLFWKHFFICVFLKFVNIFIVVFHKLSWCFCFCHLCLTWLEDTWRLYSRCGCSWWAPFPRMAGARLVFRLWYPCMCIVLLPFHFP